MFFYVLLDKITSISFLDVVVSNHETSAASAADDMAHGGGHTESDSADHNTEKLSELSLISEAALPAFEGANLASSPSPPQILFPSGDPPSPPLFASMSQSPTPFLVSGTSPSPPVASGIGALLAKHGVFRS